MTQLPLLITFVVYLLGVLALGVRAYRQTNDQSDYLLGGRKLGAVVTALSVGASDMSGWLLLGLPGAPNASELSVHVEPKLLLFSWVYGAAQWEAGSHQVPGWLPQPTTPDTVGRASLCVLPVCCPTPMPPTQRGLGRQSGDGSHLLAVSSDRVSPAPRVPQVGVACDVALPQVCGREQLLAATRSGG